GVNCSAADGETVTTPNGVEYEDIVVCDGPELTVGDTVDANYIGRLEDGTEFANTYESGDVFRFLYGQAAVINGWDEGLAGMKVGGKRRVKIPADVYGEENVSVDIIPPGATIIFEVELLDIKKGQGEVAPESPPEIDGETITTDSGLKYIDIEEGTGITPATGQRVTVHYTGWLESDGSKFDSSLDGGQAFTFTIGQGNVIKGWDEGLSTMKVGGKRRLIVPADLGYGEEGYPPVIPANAVLIFDVELLDVR
ncbi:MAG TPA: FKBP-type peptidyl-prolyl cis-trans isomerase, partial [Dehalococcoidia bacterium]|nr:FKBP-type peptidyl-prolyl cis-trans isomerase [Dehalococcoidia bacterium]